MRLIRCQAFPGGARHLGRPVFVGTRVPVRTLLEYLEHGDSLDTFLDHFPSVSRELAVAALELAKQMLLDHARAA